MQYAGFWRRFAAYCIDALPITIGVTLVFYLFLGFNVTLERYLARDPGDLEARWNLLVARNRIRNLVLALYFGYCWVLEASPLQGTLGKWAMGVAVVNADGSRLSYAQSAKRTSAKAFSFLVLGLGCLWVAWSRTKQGWHDMLVGTYVIRRARGETAVQGPD